MDDFEMEIRERLAAIGGKVGFVYKNLFGGERIAFCDDASLQTASVIKLFILAEAFRRFEDETLSPDEEIAIPRSECRPSCGAINYLHDNITLTVRDLCVLMIILSDNTATNVLIDRFGIDEINAFAHACGFSDTFLRRKMFDSEKAAQGLENTSSARDVARFFELLWRGSLVSADASAEMLSILKDQRLNGKIPFFIHSLPNARPIAHKTGEDAGVTHDAGIVFADHPFVVCFMGNEVNVPMFERLMADISLELFLRNTDQ